MKPTASRNNSTRHHEEADVLYKSEFSYVTKTIAKETITKNIFFLSEFYHNQTASIPTNLCPGPAVISSLQSLSADGLMPASVTRSHSGNIKNLVVLSAAGVHRVLSNIPERAAFLVYFLWNCEKCIIC